MKTLNFEFFNLGLINIKYQIIRNKIAIENAYVSGRKRIKLDTEKAKNKLKYKSNFLDLKFNEWVNLHVEKIKNICINVKTKLVFCSGEKKGIARLINLYIKKPKI